MTSPRAKDLASKKHRPRPSESWMPYLQQAGAEGNAFEELVECERRQQRADGAGRVADAQCDANEHRVQGDARLQHLWPCAIN